MKAGQKCVVRVFDAETSKELGLFDATHRSETAIQAGVDFEIPDAPKAGQGHEVTDLYLRAEPVRAQVRAVVNVMGDPLMRDFLESVYGTENEIKETVRQMVESGELRMKEDEIDHDWSYRKGRNWDETDPTGCAER